MQLCNFQFLIFPIVNSLKFSLFELRQRSFQYSDPRFLNFAISNFLIFQFSSSERKNYFKKKKKNLIPHSHFQFSLNFHLTFHYSSRSPIKGVGKSNDKTIRKHRRIQFNNDSHAFHSVQNYRFIGRKSLAGSVFPSHPVCTWLSVKLLIGVHASRREGGEEEERGEGRGSVNRDIGRFLAKWRCINTGQAIEKLSKVVGIALTRENTRRKKVFHRFFPSLARQKLKNPNVSSSFLRGMRDGGKKGLALNCGGKKKARLKASILGLKGISHDNLV